MKKFIHIADLHLESRLNAVATQQPSAVDSEILSQCDIIITHKITTRQDVKSLNKLSQDYMGGELKTYMRNIGEIGQAVYVKDGTGIYRVSRTIYGLLGFLFFGQV